MGGGVDSKSMWLHQRSPIDKDEAEAHSLSRPSPIGASITAIILPSLSGAQQVDRACNASGGQIGPRHILE